MSLSPNIQTVNEHFIEQLYLSHYWKAVNYANHFLKDVETAKEMAQEAMISLWQKRDQLDIAGNVAYYLLSTVRNKAFNLLKQKQRIAQRMGNPVSVSDRLGMIALGDSSADKVIHAELSATIAKTIDAMSSKISTTFLLCREEGLSYKEVAQKLNVSVKTVEYRISKALDILRSVLSEYLILIILLYNFLG